MQLIFYVHSTPAEYVECGREFPFPRPTKRCPHCGKYGTMRKHGFYERYYLGGGYIGKIIIRRYICSHCWRTISMLPSFCHKRMQYCPTVILESMYEMFQFGIGTDEASRIIRSRYRNLMVYRQHLHYYRRRTEENVGLLEYGIRQVNKDAVLAQERTDKRRRAQTALCFIKESGGFQAFWRKAYAQTGIAVLAQH